MFQRICALVAIVSFALLATANQARAIVVAANDYDDVTYTAPPSNQAIPFSNVCFTGNSGGVYLGNRWVLSAWHTISGDANGVTDYTLPQQVTFSNGQNIAVDTTVPATHLTNHSGGKVDAVLYRLATEPEGSLPTVSMAGSGLSSGDHVYLVGWGGHSAEGTSYDESGMPANGNGYPAERWGENIISFVGDDVGLTSFDSTNDAIPNEGQAVGGDSGGGVFTDDGKLVGIIFGGYTGSDPVVPFGQTTDFVRLTFFLRNEIAAITGTEPVVNPGPRLGDLNGNGIIDAADIDILATDLRNGTTNVSEDLNGDGVVNKADYYCLIGSLVDVDDDMSESANHGTHFGDANLNGQVEYGDDILLTGNFNKTNAGWEDGDFNGDGRVDGQDFGILAVNFGQSGSWQRPGDFNGDYDIDADDIDRLAIDLHNGTTNLVTEDLNLDGVVDQADMDYLIDSLVDTDIGIGSGTHYGDANLDGTVDGADYTILAINFGSTTAGWEDGDFTGDGRVDGSDYGELAENWGATGGSH